VISIITWSVPEMLLAGSVSIMRPHGAAGNEGLALWFGVEEGQAVRISHLVDVTGPGFRTTPLFMSLSINAMAALTEFADKTNVFLAGQIHSHPGTFTDLSDLDEAHGIRVPDYLSVVCPFYAQHDVGSFQECGVHYFEHGRYRRLGAQEIARRISVNPFPLQKISIRVPA
jgi:proteasome lid subunit RPN8/RPN11